MSTLHLAVTPEAIRRKKITHAIAAILLIVGIPCLLMGVYGYLMGDLNISSLRGTASEVYAARAVAQSEGTSIIGTTVILGFLTVPLSFISNIMNTAVILLLVGVMMIFNAWMCETQSLERMKDLLCIEPALFFFLMFVYYPIIDMLRISFTDMRLLENDKAFPLVGLKNYEWLFTGSGQKYFFESMKVTITYTFWEIAITLVGGMLLSLLFNRMTRPFNAMRAIVFMPKYIAVSTSAIVFIWILNGDYGVLNYILSVFGIKGPNWLNQANTALTGILFLTGWRVVGYAMMIYLSAMKGIPQDYYEAASIDGADGVQRFRFITIPMLAPTTLFLFVTTFIASMKVFQSVDVMTGGGPGRATNVMVQWIYNLSFTDARVARSAAVSVVFFIILLICTAATMRYSNKSVNYDS